METAAKQLLGAKVPTIFPGPLVLWAWNEKAAKKAKAIRHLYETIKGKRFALPTSDAYPHAGLSTKVSQN